MTKKRKLKIIKLASKHQISILSTLRSHLGLKSLLNHRDHRLVGKQKRQYGLILRQITTQAITIRSMGTS